MKATAHGSGIKEKHRSIEPRAVSSSSVSDATTAAAFTAVCACARENARAVRGSLNLGTVEKKDLELHLARCARASRRRAAAIDIGQFVEWVKERSHLTRGRNHRYHDARLKPFISRASAPFWSARQHGAHS